MGSELQTRFDHDCSELATTRAYFEHRARQLLADGFVAAPPVEELEHGGEAWGAQAWATREGQRYASVYVYAQARGRGHMRRHLAALMAAGEAIVTTPDCDIEAALSHLGARFVVAGRHTQAREYLAIERHYGSRRAQRSGAALMNHIDEGVALLRWLGAEERAERAFCLHPLVQGDADLADQALASLTEDVTVMAYAIEYRHLANAYLSPMGPREPAAIQLSPLVAVNDMLRADKIQNYADFLRFHRESHPRAEALDAYFRAWLERLEISVERFELLSERLRIPTGQDSQPRGSRGR